jgi:hypothetical protein
LDAAITTSTPQETRLEQIANDLALLDAQVGRDPPQAVADVAESGRWRHRLDGRLPPRA